MSDSRGSLLLAEALYTLRGRHIDGRRAQSRYSGGVEFRVQVACRIRFHKVRHVRVDLAKAQFCTIPRLALVGLSNIEGKLNAALS